MADALNEAQIAHLLAAALDKGLTRADTSLAGGSSEDHHALNQHARALLNCTAQAIQRHVSDPAATLGNNVLAGGEGGEELREALEGGAEGLPGGRKRARTDSPGLTGGETTGQEYHMGGEMYSQQGDRAGEEVFAGGGGLAKRHRVDVEPPAGEFSAGMDTSPFRQATLQDYSSGFGTDVAQVARPAQTRGGSPIPHLTPPTPFQAAPTPPKLDASGGVSMPTPPPAGEARQEGRAALPPNPTPPPASSGRTGGPGGSGSGRRCEVCAVVRKAGCGTPAAHPRCLKRPGAARVAVESERKIAARAPGGGEVDVDERITVWNPREGRKLSGKAAPMLKNLAAWLHQNPGWEAHPRGPSSAASKKKEKREPSPANGMPGRSAAAPSATAPAWRSGSAYQSSGSPTSELSRAPSFPPTQRVGLQVSWQNYGQAAPGGSGGEGRGATPLPMARELQVAASKLLRAWSSRLTQFEAIGYGSSKEAIDAAVLLEPDFGQMAEVLERGAYGSQVALLGDFRRTCEAVGTQRVRDISRGSVQNAVTPRTPIAIVGAANAFAEFGAKDLGRLCQRHDADPSGFAKLYAQLQQQQMPPPHQRTSSAIAAALEGNRRAAVKGEWRRQPLPYRPYQQLAANQAAGDEEAQLLQTNKILSCSDVACCRPRGGEVQCECCAGGAECGDLCACAGNLNPPCSNRAIANNRCLILAEDVWECELWGMDPYARKNIVDALPTSYGGGNSTAKDDFVSKWLLPCINRQGRDGWDILQSLRQVAAAAHLAGDKVVFDGVKEVSEKVAEIGLAHFKLHPKGVGLVCQVEGGLAQNVYVGEFSGDVFSSRRWLERQAAAGRRRRQLDGSHACHLAFCRPPDDREGNDILFVDSSRRGNFTSRLLHSCDPNCEAVVKCVPGGRIVLAIYTRRPIPKDEELTLDYKRETFDPEGIHKEVCLCGAATCRGSPATNLASPPYMIMVDERLGLLDQCVLLFRAGTEDMAPSDWLGLMQIGIQPPRLSDSSASSSLLCPSWFYKWAAIIMEAIMMEQERLPAILLSTGLEATEVAANLKTAEVIASRKQNLVIALDRVRYCLLNQPGGSRAAVPPLRLLTPDEAIQHLWQGDEAIAKRLVTSITSLLCPTCASIHPQRGMHGSMGCGVLSAMWHELSKECTSLAAAQQGLTQLERLLRHLAFADFIAARDLLLFYASTSVYLAAEAYHVVRSPPLPPRLTSATSASGRGGEFDQMAALLGEGRDLTSGFDYNPGFIWGETSFWFRHMDAPDPVAELTVRLRGTLLLPEPESCASPFPGYLESEREALLTWIEKTPDHAWPTTWSWKFAAEPKVFGSPMLDAAILKARGQPSHLPVICGQLRSLALVNTPSAPLSQPPPQSNPPDPPNNTGLVSPQPGNPEDAEVPPGSTG